MASLIVGYPRMGPKRELKFALESFWDNKSSAEDLQKVAADLRSSIWKHMADAGIKYIPSNTFSYYDQVLDTTSMLGAVPPRYGWNGGEIGFDIYFSMARGNASVPAMEMTKWFDTNYHFIVPELGPDVNFSFASHKAVDEYNEAKALGVNTVPVLIGPVSYLLLSKPAKGVEKTFSLLSLLPKILPVYKEVISELKAAGASWVQFDEPTLVLDLDSHQLQAFTAAYSDLESTLSGLNVLIETYFADLTAEAYKTLIGLKGVTAYGFDLVRGTETIDLIKNNFPKGKYLFAGVVDGRNIWPNDLASTLSTLQELEAIVGKDNLVVSTSCSLLHTAVDLVNETKLDDEIKSWLAQKVVEVNALAKALAGQKDEAFFSANAAAQASRKSSPRVTNEAVQKAAATLKDSDHRRATNVSARLDAQQKKLNLPILPTTTIGSFPQTVELRISEDDYVKAIREEIKKVVDLQEELDIDVLVHGEPERNELPDELWRKILEIGIKASSFTYEDLCRVSISCRCLHRLCNEDSLWSHLISVDFPNQTSQPPPSSSSSSSSAKSLYKIIFERKRERKLRAQMKRLPAQMMRKQSQISVHLRTLLVIEDRLREERNKLNSAISESSYLYNFRQESAALLVWQPEVVHGGQKQMGKGCFVRFATRVRALEMEVELCEQQLQVFEKAHRDEKRRLDTAKEKLKSMKYHYKIITDK